MSEEEVSLYDWLRLRVRPFIERDTITVKKLRYIDDSFRGIAALSLPIRMIRKKDVWTVENEKIVFTDSMIRLLLAQYKPECIPSEIEVSNVDEENIMLRK